MSASRSPLEELDLIAATVADIAAADAIRLAEIRTEYLGRKSGRLTNILRSLSSVAPEERRTVGLGRADEEAGPRLEHVADHGCGVAADDAARIGFWDKEGNYRIHLGLDGQAEVALYDENGAVLWAIP